MVKHTQTIRRLLPTNGFSVFGHFLGLALNGLSLSCIMLKNGQTYLKNVAQHKNITVWTNCLAISQHNVWKG